MRLHLFVEASMEKSSEYFRRRTNSYVPPVKDSQRAELSAQVEQFLAVGGKVTELPQIATRGAVKAMAIVDELV